jgi:uncharacterized protein
MKTHRVTWFSIPSDDLARATRFYAAAFGWRIEPLTVETDPDFSFHVAVNDESDGDYVQTKRGGLNGCIVKKRIGLPTPAVLVEVDDLDAAIASVKQAGGKVVGKTVLMKSLNGRFVLVQDTEGNYVELFQSLK